MSKAHRYKGGKSVLACTEKGLRIWLSKHINKIEQGARELAKDMEPKERTGK